MFGLLSKTSTPSCTAPLKIMVEGYVKAHGVVGESRNPHRPPSSMNRRRFEMMRNIDGGKFANLKFSGFIINALIDSTVLKQCTSNWLAGSMFLKSN
jgi:hypothetical protein